jgi:hypothetical protein
MPHIRRHIAAWALVVCALVFRPAAAQPLREPNSRLPGKSDFLVAPPQELLERGLKPLPTRPPDTKLRGGLRPFDVSEVVFDTKSVQPADARGAEWSTVHYQWVASDLCYRPLYFEDAMLERHGQSRHGLVQPLASGARFFLTVPVLPYAMVVNPPHPAQSALGHYRAGSGAPLLLQRPPLQADASVVEAATWVGLIFLIP